MAEPYIGEIKIVAFNYAPKGWATCSGQTLSIQQNTALFSLLGTTYGGNGVQTFALPNLQSRVPVHFGQGPGLSDYTLGQTGGAETVTLTSTQMPTHTHLLNGTTGTANKRPPAGHTFAADTASIANFYAAPANQLALAAPSVTTAGGSQPHANLQPYLAVLFCIALVGVFPSRN
jgi:microcystin-dependent protein